MKIIGSNLFFKKKYKICKTSLVLLNRIITYLFCKASQKS